MTPKVANAEIFARNFSKATGNQSVSSGTQSEPFGYKVRATRSARRVAWIPLANKSC